MKQKLKQIGWNKIAIGLFLFALAFFPIPYVVELPGDGFDASTFLQVEQGDENNQGEFLVMTVASYDASLFTVLGALFPHHSLEKSEDVYGDSSNQEHNVIQSYYMESARNHAVYYAYQAAGKSVELNMQGVFVMEVIKESTFFEQLQVGDVIVSIDQQTFQTETEFIDYIQSKPVGTRVEITFERGGQPLSATGELIQHPKTQQPALGIALVTKTAVSAQPKVHFEAHGVMGPSAGLMFSLEIYDQLTEGDLTKGQVIAGTGTIDETGRVGRIGGVDKKVVAAHRSGATIFFVPDDEITEEMLQVDPTLRSNYEEAVQKATELQTTMKIVPVKTFADALAYLNTLD